MKSQITRNLICSLFWAVAIQAAPLTFHQEPQQPPKPLVIRLSDGRSVPEGPGVICSEECVAAEAASLPDAPGSRRWLIAIPIGAGIIACAVLCRGSRDTSVNRPPVPPNAPDQPGAPVPESAPVALLAVGIFALYKLGKLE